jgi:hypothetical protein
MPDDGQAPIGGEGTESDAAENTGGESQGFDLSPLNDRLDQMQDQFSTGLEDLAGRIPSQQDEGDFYGEQPDMDGGFPDVFGEAGYDPYGAGYQEIDQDQLEQGIEQMVQSRTEALVGPLQDQIREMIDTQAAAQIEARYPELQDAQTAEAAAMEAVRSGIAPEDLSPAHIALAHEALKYREMQSQIEPTGQGGSDGMESPGGAQPGGMNDAEYEQEVQNRIVAQADRKLFN